MAEYIEREAFKAEICRLSTHYLNEWDTLGVLAAADRIPAADVRENKRGEWEYKGDFTYHCSVCDKNIYTPRLSPYNFCPNCGADMRAEEGE